MAYHQEKDISNNHLAARYSFYCANCYRDYGDDANAIKWYKNTLELSGWLQEKYISCFRLFLLYNKNYIEMCLKLGTLVYHYPERSLDSPADINNRRALMIELFDKYEKYEDNMYTKKTKRRLYKLLRKYVKRYNMNWYELRNNHSFIKKLLKLYDGKDLILNFLSFEMRNDYDLVSFIVNKNGLELEFASDKLKNNPEIVKLACLNNGLALKYASIELRNNPEIINIAISSNNHSFKFVSNDLRNDYELVLNVCKLNGFLLRYVSVNLRDNEIIALEAIKNTIYSFDFISTRLKNDKHFLFNAFQLNPNLYLIDMDISNKNFIKKIRDISINIFDLDFMKENAFYLDKFKNFKDIINYLINKNKFEIICLNNNLVNFISENLNKHDKFVLIYFMFYAILFSYFFVKI